MRLSALMPARPHFGMAAPKRSADLEGKLAGYELGWNQLIAWDRQAHPVPVLETVRLPQLMASARTFLQRQAASGASTPVPFMIGMAGGTASGKTTIKNEWLKMFPRQANRLFGWRQRKQGPVTEEIELDNYYRDMSRQYKQLGGERFFRETNLDIPDTVSLNKAARNLARLKNGQAVRAPKYDFSDCSRRKGYDLKVPAPFVVAEGLFTLVPEPLRKLFDLKVFVSADYETRATRWWARAPERNLDNDAGRAMFERGMAEHERHVEPTKAHADVVLNSAAPLKDMRDTLRRMTALLVRTFTPTGAS